MDMIKGYYIFISLFILLFLYKYEMMFKEYGIMRVYQRERERGGWVFMIQNRHWVQDFEFCLDVIYSERLHILS